MSPAPPLRIGGPTHIPSDSKLNPIRLRLQQPVNPAPLPIPCILNKYFLVSRRGREQKQRRALRLPASTSRSIRPAVSREMDLTELLPEDMLDDILRRLPPRSLAASRCVRKAWRAIVDAHRLLRPDLLPLSLGGIFLNFHGHGFTEFFSRPSTGAAISGKLDYLPSTEWSFVEDHCNGLLLLYDCVVNPATRRWAPLPPWPPQRMGSKTFISEVCIVFDPTISPHYQVFMIPRVRYWCHSIAETEWPPSPFTVDVFSSTTSRWEERSFVREGEAIGTVAQVQLAWPGERCYAFYCRGQIYVHCHFVMRYKSLLKHHHFILIFPLTKRILNSVIY